MRQRKFKKLIATNECKEKVFEVCDGAYAKHNDGTIFITGSVLTKFASFNLGERLDIEIR